MRNRSRFAIIRPVLAGALGLALATAALVMAGDWRQFRGPRGLGISDEKGLPVEWSTSQNVRWRTPLPGAGTSSPVTLGDRVFLTCYSGYAIDAAAPGEMENLKRHALCLDRASGRIVWHKQ